LAAVILIAREARAELVGNALRPRTSTNERHANPLVRLFSHSPPGLKLRDVMEPIVTAILHAAAGHRLAAPVAGTSLTVSREVAQQALIEALAMIVATAPEPAVEPLVVDERLRRAVARAATELRGDGRIRRY
jgi:hypothetical protein